MNKYSYKNIIIDPTKEGIESLIGKEVYFSDHPYICLENANKDYNIGILEKISKDSMYPFEVEDSEGEMRVFACIIIKDKEPKPEYLPFSNASEFIDAYRNATGCLNEEDYFLSSHGIWLKDLEIDTFFMVTEIWNDGVVITDSKMKTTKEVDDEYLTINQLTLWEELLRDYRFLDNSHCGRFVKE